MKARKLIAVILVTLVLLYAGFVAIDAVRLYSAEPVVMPLVTLDEELSENRVTFRGLGYSVSYLVETVEEKTDVYGVEFRLYGLLLWAWVE